jgi:hypothetical protein
MENKQQNKKRSVTFSNDNSNKKLKYAICKSCKKLNNEKESINFIIKKCKLCIKIDDYKKDSSILYQRPRTDSILLNDKYEIEDYLSNPKKIYRKDNYNNKPMFSSRNRSDAFSLNLNGMSCTEIDNYINNKLIGKFNTL